MENHNRVEILANGLHHDVTACPRFYTPRAYQLPAPADRGAPSLAARSPEAVFCHQPQDQLRVTPIIFLLPVGRVSNRGGMADPAFDSQLVHEVQKPMH